MPGTKIVIHGVLPNRDGQELFRGASNDTTRYLPDGKYNVSIEGQGIKKAVRENVVLYVHARLTISKPKVSNLRQKELGHVLFA